MNSFWDTPMRWKGSQPTPPGEKPQVYADDELVNRLSAAISELKNDDQKTALLQQLHAQPWLLNTLLHYIQQQQHGAEAEWDKKNWHWVLHGKGIGM